MMGDATALRLAIDLLHVPSRARPLRSAALPEDVLTLLEIAAGDAETTSRASELTGRTREVVRDAATFFIEQILLTPESDSYRVLGASPEATSGELRRNMALLLKWLHPDMGHNGGHNKGHNGNSNADRSVFAGRVTLAWDDLKTAERRAAYNAAQTKRGAGKSPRRGKAGRRSSGTNGGLAGKSSPRGQPTGRLWRALMTLFGAARH